MQTSWKLGASGRLEGARAAVRAALLKDEKVPEPHRTYLVALIDARPEKHNWVTLDGHWNESAPSGENQEVNGLLDLHVYSSTENI